MHDEIGHNDRRTGDDIVPDPIDVDYPTLLGGVAPNVREYPREAVIAEKLHAMVTHGEANSRYTHDRAIRPPS